jgi:thymidylate synthase
MDIGGGGNVTPMTTSVEAQTLDDLMHEVLTCLLEQPADVKATRGSFSEIIGASLHLKDPRARLSLTETRGKPFSALGELLWYLSKSNELAFIEFYLKQYREESDDGRTVYGGYGPRLFSMRGNHDQIANVITLLKAKPSSRRAVIQLFDADDIAADHKEVPCTCTLQFLLRKDCLHMFTSMRSNDAFIGLPHDVFAFTMLQEMLARSLSVEPGTYSHAVGSLHLYEERREATQRYLNEGWQSTKHPMPPMPDGDPWSSIKAVLQAEARIRSEEDFDISALRLDPYWLDLIRLLRVHERFKRNDYPAIRKILNDVSSPAYHYYIMQKLPDEAGVQ